MLYKASAGEKTMSMDRRIKNDFPVTDCTDAYMHYVLVLGLLDAGVEVIHPFILGCDTKNPKIVAPCLMSLQRLVQHQVVSEVCLDYSLILC